MATPTRTKDDKTEDDRAARRREKERAAKDSDRSDRAKGSAKDKDKDKDKAAKAKEKEKAAKAKEKEQAAKQKEREKAAKQKEKEKAAKAKEKEQASKQKEKERAAKAKEKDKAAKQKEKDRAAKGKDKDRATKAKDGGRDSKASSRRESGGRRESKGGGGGSKDSDRAARDGAASSGPGDGEVSAATARSQEVAESKGLEVHESGWIAEELGKPDAVTRTTKSPTLAASFTTRDHDIIRRWAESRGGSPADVRGTGDGEGSSNAGVLRIEFRDDQDRLETVDWDTFFQTFDESDVDFLYQEYVADGSESRFFKIVRADS